jgi:hypothetical protein
MYERTIDLMDENVFPRKSIYLSKENPSPITKGVSREPISDEEIIKSVSAEMINSLGANLEP